MDSELIDLLHDLQDFYGDAVAVFVATRKGPGDKDRAQKVARRVKTFSCEIERFLRQNEAFVAAMNITCVFGLYEFANRELEDITKGIIRIVREGFRGGDSRIVVYEFVRTMATAVDHLAKITKDRYWFKERFVEIMPPYRLFSQLKRLEGAIKWLQDSAYDARNMGVTNVNELCSAADTLLDWVDSRQ